MDRAFLSLQESRLLIETAGGQKALLVNPRRLGFVVFPLIIFLIVLVKSLSYVVSSSASSQQHQQQHQQQQQPATSNRPCATFGWCRPINRSGTYRLIRREDITQKSREVIPPGVSRDITIVALHTTHCGGHDSLYQLLLVRNNWGIQGLKANPPTLCMPKSATCMYLPPHPRAIATLTYRPPQPGPGPRAAARQTQSSQTVPGVPRRTFMSQVCTEDWSVLLSRGTPL